MLRKIKQYFKNKKFKKFIRNNSDLISLLSEKNSTDNYIPVIKKR